MDSQFIVKTSMRGLSTVFLLTLVGRNTRLMGAHGIERALGGSLGTRVAMIPVWTPYARWYTILGHRGGPILCTIRQQTSSFVRRHFIVLPQFGEGHQTAVALRVRGGGCDCTRRGTCTHPSEATWSAAAASRCRSSWCVQCAIASGRSKSPVSTNGHRSGEHD
jgi:hypothetical protein